jgi:hypothetical protein
MWGAREAFLPAAAMVMGVVMPVVFLLRLLKNAIKTLKLVIFKQYLYLLLYIVQHIAIHVTLIVVGQSPNHFGPTKPRHIGYRLKALVIARTIKHCTEAST